MLRFAANVDWKDVNPILLQRLNALGAKTHNIITIFSGYRSDSYSAAVGGFAGDPHTKGIAVDARVGGKDIGLVISPRLMAKYGLRSGNQPGFYHGKPDPSHVDLVGYEKKGPYRPPAGDVTNMPQAGQEAAAAPDYRNYAPDVPQLTPQPEELQQPILPPGTVNPGEPQIPNYMQQAWLQVSNQPDASPETQQYAQLFGQ